MTDLIDKTETLIAHLLCADARVEDSADMGGRRVLDSGMEFAEQDVSTLIKFEPMYPNRSYTFQSLDCNPGEDDSRLFTDDANLLIAPVQDTLGKESEVALLCRDRVKWTGFRKIRKAPRGVWVSAPGASLYEFHYREIFANGVSSYFKRVAAISKSGKPVICLVEGSSGSNSKIEGYQAVIAASLIEDAHRVDALTASITDATTIILPVPIGDHKELFALRDAPMTPAGRRRAILHWVSMHTRRTQNNNFTTVKEHTRGVREFAIDGFRVRLEPNVFPSNAAARSGRDAA